MRFHIVSTEPAVAEISDWAPYFKVNFNNALSSAGLSVTMQPDIIYDNQVRVSGKTLTVYLSVPFDSKQTYTITINAIADIKGQRITDKKFSFTPRVGSRDQLSDDQQEALIIRNQQSPIYKDPILTHLPYHGVDFTLSSSIGTSTNNQPVLTLQAQIMLHAAQMGDESAAVAQSKQQVQDYIRSFGLDPSKYSISYSVVTP